MFSYGDVYAIFVWFVATAIAGRIGGLEILNSLLLACVPTATWALGIVTDSVCYYIAKVRNTDKGRWEINEVSKKYAKRIVFLVPVVAVFILGVFLCGQHWLITLLLVVPFEISLAWQAFDWN